MPDSLIAPFKRCSMCEHEWQTAEELLGDHHMRFEAYQCNRRRVHAGLPAEGIVIFTHLKEGCGTSLAVRASMFQYLPSIR